MIIFFCWVWNFLEPYFNMIIEMKNKYNWEAWEKEKKKKKNLLPMYLQHFRWIPLDGMNV